MLLRHKGEGFFQVYCNSQIVTMLGFGHRNNSGSIGCTEEVKNVKFIFSVRFGVVTF